MSNLPFTEEGALYTAPSFGIAVSDFTLHSGTRRQQNGDIVAFGQTRLALADQGNWIFSRSYPPHDESLYDGAAPATVDAQWKFVRCTARNLSITEATAYEGDDEIARVPATTTLHATWGLTYPEQAISDPIWDWKLTNLSTGATVQYGTVGPVEAAVTWSVTLTGLAAALYSLWVTMRGPDKAFAWPDDYRIVTEADEFQPAAYAWEHPTLGTLYFDPIYNIGAMPYDDTVPAQKALLDSYTAAIADGTAITNPDWADYLISFNADGTQSTPGGEYACLLIAAGSTAWAGDYAPHINSNPGPCFWKKVSGTLTPQMLHPQLRILEGYLDEGDDGFWVSGMVAGRSGRKTCLLKVDTSWHITDKAYGQVPDPAPDPDAEESDEPPSRTGCARLSSEAGVSVERIEGDLYVMAYGARFFYDPFALIGARLIPTGKGGFSLTRLAHLTGSEQAIYETDYTQLTGQKIYKNGLGHTLSFFDTLPGPSTAKVLPSCLAAKGAFWAVVEETIVDKRSNAESSDELLNNVQQLAWITNTAWTPLNSWYRRHWDMGRVVHCGPYVLVFGIDVNNVPSAHRLKGDVFDKGLQMPYYVEWAGPALSADGKKGTAFIIGRKATGRRARPGIFLAETTGEPPHIDFVASVTTQPVTGTSRNVYCASVANIQAAGFDLAAFAPYLVWIPVLSAWQISATIPDTGVYPSYLHLDTTGDPYCWVKPAGVPFPYTLANFCSVRFEAGFCETPPTPPNPCGAMDIVYCIDTTNSMGPAIANVLQELGALEDNIRQAVGTGIARLALLDFRDDVKVWINFSDNNYQDVADVMKTFRAYSPPSNTQIPEASDEAIKTVVFGRHASDVSPGQQTGDFSVAFRSGAIKVIILVTDAPPGGFINSVTSGPNLATITAQAVAIGARISAVYTPTNGLMEDQSIPIMQDYAATTGGYFLRAQSNGKGTGSAIADIINGCGGKDYNPIPEACTTDLAIPVPCCADASCVVGPTDTVGVFCWPQDGTDSPGPINAVTFYENIETSAFRAMVNDRASLWLRIDGETTLTLDDGDTPDAGDLAVIAEFDIAMPFQKEFWLPRQAQKKVELLVVKASGVHMDAVFDVVA